MTRNMAKTIMIPWSDLYVPNTVLHFLIDLKYLEISDIFIDQDLQQTKLEGATNYATKSSKTIDLIPDQVLIDTDKSIKLYLTKIFNLEDFSNIVSFIKDNCPYIYDFIQDQNINSVKIAIEKNLRSSSELRGIELALDEFLVLKNWLSNEDPKKLAPIVLAALIQKFYQPDSEIFRISTSPALSRIKQYVDHINSLLDDSIDILKNYSIRPELDSCMSNSNLFKFLNHTIVRSKCFQLYQHNMDIKFLSYISCGDLKEKANIADRSRTTHSSTCSLNN